MDSQQVISTPPKTIAPKKPGSGKAIALLSLLVAIVAIAGIVYVWQQTQINEQQNIKQIVSLQQDVSKAMHLSMQQQEALRTTQQDVQTIGNQNRRDAAGWTLMEAEYLVRLATFNLIFERNVTLAQQLLAEADQRLQALNDPALWPVRQILAEDMAHLHAIPVVDLPGIVARLGALTQQAEQLPQLSVATPTQMPTSIQATATTESQLTMATILQKIRLFVTAVGRALSTMVTITHAGDKFTPTLLTVEQHAYLITNIQSQLTLAQWAVVHRQQDTYQQALTQVTDWLTRYYSPENPLVHGMLQQIDEIKTIIVNPAMPDISHSLDAIQRAKG